jgi:hypothetical protein
MLVVRDVATLLRIQHPRAHRLRASHAAFVKQHGVPTFSAALTDRVMREHWLDIRVAFKRALLRLSNPKFADREALSLAEINGIERRYSPSKSEPGQQESTETSVDAGDGKPPCTPLTSNGSMEIIRDEHPALAAWYFIELHGTSKRVEEDPEMLYKLEEFMGDIEQLSVKFEELSQPPVLPATEPGQVHRSAGVEQVCSHACLASEQCTCMHLEYSARQKAWRRLR